jgi:endonuclease/exonuclease/phosphatase family metal-dependent hydrolase
MKRSALVGIILFLVFGCGAGTHKRIELMPPVPAACPASPSDSNGSQSVDQPYFRATTVNIGLAPGVQRYNPERRRPVYAVLKHELQRSDLVCVQEAWLPADRQAVLKAVGLPANQVHLHDSRGEGESGLDRCTPDQVSGILDCMRDKCSDVAAADAAICAREKCLWKLVWLYLSGRRCLNCLTAMVGHSTAEAERMCVNGPGRSRAYRGSNGLLLLSRRPLRNRTVVRLPASGTNRVALLASVEVAPGKTVEVGCVHISSSLKQSPTSGFSSWEAEQAAQLRLTAAALARRAGGRPQLLLGDMNFGQRHGPVNEVMWPTWHLAGRLGYVSAAGHARPPICSYCRGNRLSWTKARTLIDHILLRQGTRGFKLEPLCAETIMDQPVLIRVNGRHKSVHPSDHYGIAVGFRLRPLTWRWPPPPCPPKAP